MFMSCGDALVDLFSQPQSVSGRTGEVVLSVMVGGSPLNVAVGLARLGNKSAFLCKNSEDFIGQDIVKYLEANGVDTRFIVPTDLNSTLALIQTRSDGSARYAFYTSNTADVSLQASELPADLPEEIRVLSFGSYSTALDPTRTALTTLAEREKSSRLIAYDPNLRMGVQPDLDIWRESFSQFAGCAGFVKASDEDIATLNGNDYALENFASDAISRGAQLVVITQGEKGASLYSNKGGVAQSKPINVDVIDTVGAGDTFHCASLHYLHAQGHIVGHELDVNAIDLQSMVDFAAHAAGVTCSRKGPDLPTLGDLT